MATDQIRQLMKTLVNTGYGSVRGEGAEMTYVPVPGDRQLQLDLAPPVQEGIDKFDDQLTVLSISQTEAGEDIQDCIDTIDQRVAELEPVAETSISNQCPDLREEKSELEFDPTAGPMATIPGSEMEPERQLEAQTCHNREPNQSNTATLTTNPHFQRGDSVEAWLKDRWVPATYIRPIDRLILSHRTLRLDDGHQIMVAESPQSSFSHRIAASDLRPGLNPKVVF